MENKKAPVELSRGKLFLVMAGASVMIVCVSLSGTGLSINMSNILSQFNATHLYGIVAVLGTLSMAIGTPIAASLTASLGIRKMAVIDATALLIASILTALASNANLVLFVFTRFAMGFSVGMITGSIYPVASYVYSPNESGKGYGIFTAAIALGAVLGGTIAGLLADYNLLLWSIIYPGIICVIGALPLFIYFPSIKGKRKKTDFVGLFLLVIVLALLLFPINFNSTFGWSHPIIIGFIVMFFIMLVVLIKFENKQKNPMMPFKLLKNRGFAAACSIGLVGVGIFTALISNYIPILCQSVIGTTASVSGLVTLPKAIVTMIMPGFIAAWLVIKQGRHWVILVGSGLFVLIPALALAFNSSTSTSVFFVITMVALVGVADSCKGVALNNYAQSQLALDDVPQGIGLLGLISTIAAVIGSAIFGMLLGQWNPTATMPETIRSALTQEQLTTLSQSGSYMVNNSAVSDIRATLPAELGNEYDITIHAIRESLGSSIGNMFIVCAVCGTIVILISVLVVRVKGKAKPAEEDSSELHRSKIL